MNNNKQIRVAITQGDTNGIGYELIFKAFSQQEMFDICTPVIYGSAKVADIHRQALNADIKYTVILHFPTFGECPLPLLMNLLNAGQIYFSLFL